jgi:transcriptional regulator with XRE-family HTH domain
MSSLDLIFAQVGPSLSLARLAAVAGLHPSHLSKIKLGKRKPTAATVAKLRLALVRIRTRQVAAPNKDVALYRALLALACTELGLDAALVQNSNPALRFNLNQEWRDASYARWLAQYLMNCGLGVSQSDVARACGLTKQAICKNLPEIEDRRERDAAFDVMVSRLEELLVGAA